MSIRERALGLMAILCLSMLPAMAQVGKIRGVVTDQSGAAIPGALVTAESSATGVVHKVETGPVGRYEFLGLAIGNYIVSAKSDGFKTTQRVVSVRSRQATVADFTLDIGNLTETIEVSGQAPMLQTSQASVSHSQVGRRRRRIKSRNYAVLMHTAPQPLPSDREQYAHIDENGFLDPHREPLSTFSIDVDTASYTNTRRFLNYGQLPPVDAVRVEELINYFDYEYPEPSGEDPVSITLEVTECPWNEKNQLVHIGLRARSVSKKNLPPANLVFLIDVSGSMGSADKLPLLKRGFRLLAKQMRPQDQVSIVVYAGAAGQVLEPTSGRHTDRILAALDQLESGGSTAGGAGIRLAYKVARDSFIKKGNNRVILATDGDFNVGVSDDGSLIRMIEKERESGVFLSVLGFGQGNLQDAKMEQIADHGNGVYGYIDNITEAKRIFVEQLGSSIYTIAKDVKAQVEFNPAHVAAYRLVGYENRLLEDRDFNDDKKDAGDMGAGHTVTAFYEIVPVGTQFEISTTDPLRYQKTMVKPGSAAVASELFALKVRYKAPDGDKSKLLLQTFDERAGKLAFASNNMRWATAVAMYGMMLRDSPYLVDAKWRTVRRLAEGARGSDAHGRRAEFLTLAEEARRLTKERARSKSVN